MALKDGFGRHEAKGTIGTGQRPSRPARMPEVPPPLPPPGFRPRWDRSDCPAGYDPQLWHLAKLFRQYAQADGIELPKGLPVIHDEISDLVLRYGVRGRTFRHEVDGCEHRADHPRLASRCWYHWPPKDPEAQRAVEITWVQMIEIIMAEFWSRQWDGHALDHFRQHFAEYGQAATKHWRNLRIVQSARANPAPAVMMRRRTPGGTMDDASKEG